MTNFDSLLINKKAPEKFWELIEAYQSEDEPLLFAVIGDLDLNAHYGQGAVAVGKKGFFVLDIEKGTVKSFDFSEVKGSKIKRMYSNAYFEIEKKSGEKETVMRFTFSVASLMDMTSKFISSVCAGKDFEAEMNIVRGTYEKLMCVCPKCGRTLLHPGAPCIKCQSKGRIFKKFAPYVVPEKWSLLLCLAIHDKNDYRRDNSEQRVGNARHTRFGDACLLHSALFTRRAS